MIPKKLATVEMAGATVAPLASGKTTCDSDSREHKKNPAKTVISVLANILICLRSHRRLIAGALHQPLK